MYLEQPAFVGWSYSNTSSDKNTGDKRATIDNYAFVQVEQKKGTSLSCSYYFVFLKGFLELYPDYVNRPTWFSGESYGGPFWFCFCFAFVLCVLVLSLLNC